MNEYCAFSKDHKCIKWTDYELTRHELDEADELCHCNQIEIQFDNTDKLFPEQYCFTAVVPEAVRFSCGKGAVQSGSSANFRKVSTI